MYYYRLWLPLHTYANIKKQTVVKLKKYQFIKLSNSYL